MVSSHTGELRGTKELTSDSQMMFQVSNLVDVNKKKIIKQESLNWCGEVKLFLKDISVGQVYKKRKFKKVGA